MNIYRNVLFDYLNEGKKKCGEPERKSAEQSV